MIRTFEDLFEKLEAAGRKNIKLRLVYEWLKECCDKKSGEDVTVSELNDLYDGIAAQRIKIEGYLDCLCDEGYLSNEEWTELYKVMSRMHYRCRCSNTSTDKLW